MYQFIKLLVKKIVAGGFLVAVGISMFYVGVPKIIAWSISIFFICLVGYEIIYLCYRAIKGLPLVIENQSGFLKNGKNYLVEVSDNTITLVNKITKEKSIVEWEELTSIYIIAIDNYPIGSMSFVLHRGSKMTEIPTDAEGGTELLKSMQEKLAGFDNKAVVEAMGILHGFKEIWKKT